MSHAFEVGEPILNSPYMEPQEHWLLEEGKPAKKELGRRSAGYFYRDPKAPPPGPDAPARGAWVELKLVNLIRNRTASWSDAGHAGITRTTADLLAHWRREGREQPLFFAQLEAAETIIFLTEARSDLLQGIEVPPEDTPAEVDRFTRYACKMATGSGKTTVMAMLASWSILNKVANKSDSRFSDVVLVVCPNVTIRNRLRELDPNEADASVYRTRDLVPSHLMPNLRQGRVLVKNWHEFERKGMSAGAKVQRNGVRETFRNKIKIGSKTTSGRAGKYLTLDEFELQKSVGLVEVLSEKRSKTGELVEAQVEETRYVESDTALIARLLGKEVGGKQNLLVFNDEAHHAYRIRPAEENLDEDESELLDEEREEDLVHESTVWIDGLDRIHNGRQINFCVDLSATPYFLARAGEDTNRVFPWVVSDFGLSDAIESGLVKIPQLAVSDPTGEDRAAYFNIWRWILTKLTAAERGGKHSNPKPEAILKYAHHPIKLLAEHWSEIRKEWAEGGEEARPPVFILVCKNTKIAKVFYEFLAEGAAPAGIPPSDIADLRNGQDQTVTIRVDSKVVAEREMGGAKSDESAWMRHTLDTVGRLDWPRDDQGRAVYPEGFVELARKLDRPLHPPGRDIRCIVSVGMLTEGWDCSTVTHIVGLRPFMSQLLCEQVVGRGLRRASYEIGEDGKLTEEVAKILGVPFEVIPFKSSGGGPPPPSKRKHVIAIPEKAQFEITFPRVEGYQQEIRNRIVVDWDSVPGVKVDPMDIPTEVQMKAGLPTNSGRPSLAGPGKLEGIDLAKWRDEVRIQQREFDMAASLTKVYSRQESCQAPPQVLFPQILQIVQQFVLDKVEVDSPEKKVDVFLSPYWGFAIERLQQAIRPASIGQEAAELPRYESRRGPGSTGEVDLWTSKPVREVVKSHVNYVVADTKQWEQSAAYYIDTHPKVVAFVKNQGLGFSIPYLHNGQMHDYVPDFLIRLENGVTLILETKGHDELEEVKAAAAGRWVDAVNAEGSFGEWRYEVVHEMARVAATIDECVSTVGAPS